MPSFLLDVPVTAIGSLMPLPIPESADAITPEWLGAALGRRVATCCVQRIGQNESFTGGSLLRLSVAYETGAGPASYVVKLSPKRPALRASLARANQREVGFYKSLPARNSLPVPRCYYADFDANSGTSVTVVEDFPAARSVSFTKGCSASDAGTVVRAMAEIHGTYWQASDLDHLEGPSLFAEFDFPSAWAVYAESLAQIQPDTPLPDRFRAVGDFLAQNGAEVFEHLLNNGPRTCLHRDLQVDNVLFAEQGPILLDWQFMGQGKGAFDLGYFLISSLDPDVRRGAQDRLIAEYCAALRAQGVTDYPLAECRRDYVMSVAGKFLLSVIATVRFDNSTPHKRAWRQVDLQRLVAFCGDYNITPDSFSL
ncbi:phosphotransferase [Roseobacter sp. N2S]|uniref:phosphotransferase family protein n=1 Tax=Roseobacter sp. N2S TaxID=2663844 RepID=UPI00286BDDF3|nr:phosphotransferase [Roseobacter sp. N2S]